MTDKGASLIGFDGVEDSEMAKDQMQSMPRAPTVLSLIVGEEKAAKVYEEWRLTLWLGPILGFVVFLLLEWASPAGLRDDAKRLAGVAVWLGEWWMTEALPLGVASMLPLCAFPVLQITTNSKVAQAYSSTLFWLFFGGLQMSRALERCGLHRRIALVIIRAMGTRVALLQLGLNLAVASLSMFLSNTSTTVMLLPVALALIQSLETGNYIPVDIKKPLLLGLAYSASGGGIGTIIGTGTNGVLVLNAAAQGYDLSFALWSSFGMPFSAIMVLVIWLYFLVVYKVPFTPLPAEHPLFEELRVGAGPVTQAEVRVGIVFACTVFGWMTRSMVEDYFCLDGGFWKDDVISIIMVLVLFTVKAEYKNGEVKTLMDWEALLKTPWELFFLYGGGLALAQAFAETELSAWLGGQLGFVTAYPDWAVIMIVVFCVTFLTEVTSNVATSNVWLPIVAEMAINMGKSPLFLMIPVAMAASCAFCLPVATPPNAVVFGSGMVSIADMARAGITLSLTGVLLVTAYTLAVGPLVFDFENHTPNNGIGTNATECVLYTNPFR